MSLPSTIAMAVMAFYNIVDTLFIGRGVGVEGLGAVTITFPLFMIIIALALWIGVGSAANISIKLGQKKYKEVQHVLGSGIVLAVLIGGLVSIIGLTFMTPLLKLFGASVEILPLAAQYMRVLFAGTIISLLNMLGTHSIRAQGRATAAMIAMIIGAVINMGLDYVFIFIFEWGMKGAALATVISQAISLLFVVGFLMLDKKAIRLQLKELRPKKTHIKKILGIGLPAGLRQTVGSVTGLITNLLLVTHGSTLALAAYGIVFRILSFVLMPLFGILQGAQPIIGFNHGAKKFFRVRKTLITGIKWTTIFGFITLALLIIFAKPIAGWFSTDPELIAMSAVALQVMIIVLPTVGFQVMTGGYYQAVGKTKPALFLALLRQLILFVPIVIILAHFFGLVGILIAFPIADLLGAIITGFFARNVLKSLNK